MVETYTATEAAKRLGIAPQTLRNLIHGKKVPFGFSFREPSGRKRCVIPKQRFDRYMSGEDIAFSYKNDAS